MDLKRPLLLALVALLVSAPVADRMAALSETVRALHEAGIRAEDIALRRPTLDEVFLYLTGEQQHDEANDGKTHAEVAV